jgi:phosphoribosylamine--glycine ligase
VVELFLSCARGTLPTGRARTQSQTAVAVVAATADYPSSVERDLPISGVDALPDDVLCFHSGTRRDQEGTLRTSGGRVLTMVGHDHDASAARAKAYGGIAKISFPGMRYRSDIAEIVSRVTV